MNMNDDQKRRLVRQFLEDCDTLEQLAFVKGLTASRLRQTSPILRKWLSEGLIFKLSNVASCTLKAKIPDLRVFHRFCETGNCVWFAGITATIVDNKPLENPMVSKAGCNPPKWLKALTEVKFSHFIEQKALYLNIFANRRDVINFVSNKDGGAHFDINISEPPYKTIEEIRYMMGFKPTDSGLELTVNFDGSLNADIREFDNETIDLALLVLQNTTDIFLNSVKNVRSQLSKIN